MKRTNISFVQSRCLICAFNLFNSMFLHQAIFCVFFLCSLLLPSSLKNNYVDAIYSTLEILYYKATEHTTHIHHIAFLINMEKLCNFLLLQSREKITCKREM